MNSTDKELLSAKNLADRLYAETSNLTHTSTSVIRMYIALNLWTWLACELFSEDNKNPLISFEEVILINIELIKSMKFHKNYLTKLGVFPKEKKLDFQSNIGDTFKDIWLQYEKSEYFERTFNDTRDRYLINNIDPYDFYNNKYVLDAGCGSGKVTSAIAKFGAKKIIGIDLTEEGLNFAQSRSKEFKEGKNIKYIKGNCKSLPFEDNSFDIVHSNGVIHHTDDYEKCLSEFSRVLKPSGKLWIFVMGRSGIFEIIADTVRKIMENVDRGLFMNYLKTLGFSSGRIYWITDHCYAKYHWKSKNEFENLLHKYNFKDFCQLKRGINIDQNELLSQKKPYSELKFGEGQLKYIATKK